MYSQVSPIVPMSFAPNDEQIQILTSWVLQQAPAFGCVPSDCKILVHDFMLPDGKSSAYGIQLADQFSRQLIDPENHLQVIDRRNVREFVEFARPHSDGSADSNFARRVGEMFGAQVMVVGKINKTSNNDFELTLNLLSPTGTEPAKEKTESIHVEAEADFSPLKFSAHDPPRKAVVNGDTLSRYPVKGLSMPACFYMPNPPNTSESKAAHFDGAVLLLAIVGKDGQVVSPLVTKSPGMRLAESAIITMKTWKCRPASLDGKLVPFLIEFEVGFHWYQK